MIRIVRAEEPAKSSHAREWRLASALIRGKPPATIVGYDAGRQAIWDQQRHKCAYCEAQIGYSDDIDHHRPKEHYWWLGWSWDNLLQTCATCHGKKCTRYLREGAPRLQFPELPPGAEEMACRPVDPARDEPREHLRYRPKWANGECRWEPVSLTRRGGWTIELVGLHDEHLAAFEEHVAHLLAPGGHLDTIKKEIAAGGHPKCHWRAELANRLAPGQQYRSLSFEVLVEFRRRMRRQYRRRLAPVPPFDVGPPPPPYAPLLPPDPTLDRWPEPTRLYIRLVRSGNATTPEKHDALRAVLDEGPQTRADLADLFRVTPGTIRDWIKPLIPAPVRAIGRGDTTRYRLTP